MLMLFAMLTICHAYFSMPVFAMLLFYALLRGYIRRRRRARRRLWRGYCRHFAAPLPCHLLRRYCCCREMLLAFAHCCFVFFDCRLPPPPRCHCRATLIRASWLSLFVFTLFRYAMLRHAPPTHADALRHMANNYSHAGCRPCCHTLMSASVAPASSMRG